MMFPMWHTTRRWRVVTDTVRQETHKEDIRLVEETKKWVLLPERKAPKKEREYAAERLDGVITKIKNAMQHALAKIQRTLMQRVKQPEVKQPEGAGQEESQRIHYGYAGKDKDQR